MARRKKAVTGLVSELAAQLNLAKDPNILVFTPLGGLGPVDIVTLNMTTGEYTAYDVKSKNYRKADSYVASDGYKRNLKGSFISRNTTKEQKKLKVKILYATI
jgi:hypothetical protein|tara:strand:- start:1648 stop:1956 length:309 start_codon:yes stop_codon:yes gene_type:complete